MLLLTIELPSGLEKALKTLADLFVGKVFTAFELGLANIYGFNETGVVLKIARENILCESIDSAPFCLGDFG
jgi:hypothetical protein